MRSPGQHQHFQGQAGGLVGRILPSASWWDAGGFCRTAIGGTAASGQEVGRRLLLAVDVLTATGGRPNRETPAQAAYYDSLVRRIEDRQALARALAERGFQVVPVPCLGDEEGGINTVNAVQTPDACLLPVVGGVFRPLADAAVEVYRGACGPKTRVIPIETGHAQTMFGGLHCMVSVLPPGRPATSR